jgi:hypothetical protein
MKTTGALAAVMAGAWGLLAAEAVSSVKLEVWPVQAGAAVATAGATNSGTTGPGAVGTGRNGGMIE